MKKSETPFPLTPLLHNLKRRARRLSNSTADAEDLVQDTLLRISARQQGSNGIDNLPAYTMRTLHNEARMQWRRHAPPEELNDHDASPPAIAMDRLICAETLQAIEQLPVNQLRLMRCVCAGETSPKVLAELTGWPIGTVMSRLGRVRTRLREILQPED